MAKRLLRYEEDEILRKKSKPVKQVTQAVLTLLDDMAETMYENAGAGLAAVQVGVLKRIVVIDIGEGLIELINPVITDTEGEQTGKEGCLSVPGYSANVVRPLKVTVKALDRSGAEFELEAEEYLAVAVCHELDHLDGILFTDKCFEDEIAEEEEENVI